LEPGEPGRNRLSQSFGAMLVMLKFNGFQRNEERPDDVVTGFAHICAKGSSAACCASRILHEWITRCRDGLRKR
jgi:hypothetical protein